MVVPTSTILYQVLYRTYLYCTCMILVFLNRQIQKLRSTLAWKFQANDKKNEKDEKSLNMSTPRTPSSDGLNNRFNSYQQSGSYIPPGQQYADNQTNVLSDTVKTQYEAENTANAVLQQLSAQRQQIQGANEDVWDMRNATEETKRELRDLQDKYRARKRKLYIYIGILGFVDFLLFLRLLKCHGSFFCRSRYN